MIAINITAITDTCPTSGWGELVTVFYASYTKIYTDEFEITGVAESAGVTSLRIDANVG